MKEALILRFIRRIQRRRSLYHRIQVNLPLRGLIKREIGRDLRRRRRGFGCAILCAENERRVDLHPDVVGLRRW